VAASTIIYAPYISIIYVLKGAMGFQGNHHIINPIASFASDDDESREEEANVTNAVLGRKKGK